MYSVRLAPQPAEFYRNADVVLAKKLARCFVVLEVEPHSHPNIKRLRGPLAGYSRYRVGDYRVVYRIDEEAHAVVVILIAHRSKVYD